MTSFLSDKRFWIVVALVLVVATAHFTGIGKLLSLDTLRTHRETLTGWVGQNPLLAALAYVVIYIIAVTFSFPGASILSLSGGFLFGALFGGILTVIGATIGAIFVFLFAKSMFGDNALDRFGETAHRLSEGIRRNAGSYLLVLRFVPLFPFFLVNLVSAFVGVPLLTYAVTTFFGIMPATAVFSLAGAGLGSVLDQGGDLTPASILKPELIAGMVLLAVLTLVAIPLRKRFG
jgi:uncharacterized membrane protein YdjX (TVP38/TMEM64 family)